MRKKSRLMIAIGIWLLIVLACNFPGISGPAPTQTPLVYVTVMVATPTPREAAPTATDPAVEITPTPTETVTATAAITTTLTPTATATLTATASRPTATVPPGPPLSFDDPPWEFVEWHRIPDTSDYEGAIRYHVIGGTPPYQSQLEDGPIVDGLEITFRWRLCEPMPATARVWSADGQAASTRIWIWQVGCED